MTTERFADEQLREAFGQMGGIAEHGAGCPPPERLVEAGRGALRRGEREQVFLHITRCPACAAAWRATRELAAGLEPASEPVAKRRVLSPTWARLAAATILVALVSVGWYVLDPDRKAEPLYRTQENRWLQSALVEGQALGRESFVLRWTAGPQGTFYDVEVLSERLEPLTDRYGVTEPEYRVPVEVLETIPSGARILWQVTARLPDGQRIESQTFLTEVE